MIKYLFLFLLLISCKQKKQNNPDILNGDKLYNEGINLLQKNDFEAYKKFQLAISYYNKHKDYSNISKSLICQAIAQQGRGDIFGAEATLVEALKIMSDKDESLFSVYDTMANLKLDQKEYAQAIKWYNKALAENVTSEESKISILNNKSVASFKLGNYSEALKILQKIDLAKISDLKLKNRVKENIEYVKWLNNKNYFAQENIDNIIKLKLQNSDYWGLNSSYAHLSEIYKEKNPQRSLLYAKKMFEVAKKNKSPEDKLEAIERIILVDNPDNSKNYFHQYKTLSDSIQISRNDYRTRFAYIKYDSEKKESENQQLKIQKAEKDIDVLYRNIGLGILSILIIGGFFWYKKRRKRLQQEKELEVKNTELRYSKKVHDVVANGIYQVMTKIENQDNFNKDEALDELEFVYEKSRDISYEKLDEEKEFSKEISTLIASYNNTTIKTFTAGNNPAIWETISPTVKEEVFQMIRELMVNMKKHSEASHVALKFEKINNTIEVQYKDNGVGISGELIYKNGLRNTVFRIDGIGGSITFDTKIEKGLKINFSFPIS